MTRAALLLTAIVALPCCGPAPEGLCESDPDCGPCEVCADGACLLDQQLLNACGQCALSPDDPCCGDGRRDPGERCDGDCPASCTAPDACSRAELIGSAQTCDAECQLTQITSCEGGDGCCAPGCDHTSDSDCPQPCSDGYPCAQGCCGWQIEFVDQDDYVGEHVDIAIDTQGHLHLSYFDGIGTDLRYAYWDGATWTIEAVDADNDSGRYTSIAVDVDDRPHIAYQDDGYGQAKYGYRTTSGWDIKTVWDGGMNARYMALALDADQRPHVAYQADYGLPVDLEYAVWNGSSWEIETVDTGGTVGKHASMALDAAGSPHLSYSVMFGGESSWRYATKQGAGWQLHTLDSSYSFDIGQHTSIAVDATGAVSIAASSGLVQLARGRGTTFSLETVAGGSYPALAIGPSGSPSLAFHDGLDGTLNFAYLLGDAWAIQVVDDTAFVGEYATLALTTTGAPVIAYSDRSAHQLKLAR